MGIGNYHPSGKMTVMFDLAYYNPKMNGNVYRGIRKCGKDNCKCATSPNNKHRFWRLEYRIKQKGRWVRKRKYVPKHKVKALRQRIRRAKQKDMQRREQIAFFIQQASHLLKGETGATAEIFTLSQKVKPITLRHKTQLLNVYVELIINLEGLK